MVKSKLDLEKKYVPELSRKEIEELRNTIKSSSMKLISENIQRMKTPNRPAHMQYFDEMADPFGPREKEVRAHKEAGEKIIGYYCMFAPVELIYAANALPLRIESGFYDTTKLGDRIVPVEVCPVMRSTIGLRMVELSPYLELCDALISPNTCDGKTKLGEILGDYLPIWTMIPPRVKDKPQSKNFWFQEIKEITKKLEDLVGTPISRENLRVSIEVVLRATRAFRRLQNLRKGPPVIMGRDAMLVNQIASYDDLERWTKNTEELCDELEKRVNQSLWACPPDTPRVMLTGSPMIWPDNWKIPNLIEESKPQGVIVCDEFCSGDRFLYDPVGIDEWTMDDMINAIAEKYLLPCTCPCFTSSDGNKDRVNRILEMATDFRVDGVIYHVLRGCHLYAIEYTRIKRVLDRENIPLYYLDTEYGREDVGQMKTRIEAFLEMLETRVE